MGDIFFQIRLAMIKTRGERYKKAKKLRDEYAEYFPNKKNHRVSNMMLFVIVVAIVGYSIANYILQYRFGIEISPTLTTCWFTFWGVEIVSLAGIKVSKIIKSTNENESKNDNAVG